VSVQASGDGGLTWLLPCLSLSGDVGLGVSPGPGRQVQRACPPYRKTVGRQRARGRGAYEGAPGRLVRGGGGRGNRSQQLLGSGLHRTDGGGERMPRGAVRMERLAEQPAWGPSWSGPTGRGPGPERPAGISIGWGLPSCWRGCSGLWSLWPRTSSTSIRSAKRLA